MPNTENSPARRIQWVSSEWDRVAKAAIELRPTLINSDTLLDLDKATFLQAQMVLDEDRRRNPAGIPSVQIVRPRLLESIKKFRAEAQAQQREQEAQEAAKKAKEAQEAAARAELEAIPVVPPPNPYEVAFAPLIDLIASRVAGIMREDMRKVFAEINPKAAEVIFDPLPDVTGRAKPRIGVLGPFASWEQELRGTFPDVEFIIYEQYMDANEAKLERCEYVIAMVDYANHGAEKRLTRLKGKLGNRYQRVNGGISAVKRLIGILLTKMGHKVDQGAKPQAAQVAALH